MNRLVVFIAEGFGSGRVPKAPGTVGSLVGIVWFGLLLLLGNWTAYLIGTGLGIAISVWVCGRAETILGKHDPGSVVLDEIVALPVTYLGWIGVASLRTSGTFPSVSESFHWRNLGWIAAGFVLFRVFDIWKPWPIRQIQHLPRGWGITADDVVAGLVAAGCLALGALAV